MSDNDESLFLEIYRARMQYFANQGDRTWLRFYYFLTVELALASVYLAGDKNLVGDARNLLPFLGILFSLLWYLIGAQDVYFYEGYRKAMSAAEELVLSKSGKAVNPTNKYIRDIKPNLFCFKIRHIGVTTFAAICPLLFLILWILSFFMR